jgi:hypothetical protein
MVFDNKKLMIIHLVLFFLLFITIIYVKYTQNSQGVYLPDSQDGSISDDFVEKVVQTPNNDLIKDLVGTCPRDRHCTVPTCSLWSDLDNDNLCDRGE